MLRHGRHVHNFLLALTATLLILHLRSYVTIAAQIHPRGMKPGTSRRVGLRLRLTSRSSSADGDDAYHQHAALQLFDDLSKPAAWVGLGRGRAFGTDTAPKAAAPYRTGALPLTAEEAAATAPPTAPAPATSTAALTTAAAATPPAPVQAHPPRVKGRGRLVYVNNGCNNAWRRAMGFTGECVQHEAMLRAFKAMRVNYVELPEEDWRTEALQCGQFDTSDVSIVLTAGCHDCARKYAAKPCLQNAKVIMLDWFGTAAEHVPKGVTMATAMMPPPGDTHSHYLGYALPRPHELSGLELAEQAVAEFLRKIIHKKDHGVLLGKDRRYWAKKRALVAALVAHGVELHCVKCGLPGVKEYKRTLAKAEYGALLSSARFVLGAGDPIGSPSPLEALQDGTVVIIPRFDTPFEKMGRKHLTQHDDFARLVEQQPELAPYVCAYGEASKEELIACVDNALALPKHAHAVTLNAFTQRAFELRVEAVFRDALL